MKKYEWFILRTVGSKVGMISLVSIELACLIYIITSSYTGIDISGTMWLLYFSMLMFVLLLFVVGSTIEKKRVSIIDRINSNRQDIYFNQAIEALVYNNTKKFEELINEFIKSEERKRSLLTLSLMSSNRFDEVKFKNIISKYKIKI